MAYCVSSGGGIYEFLGLGVLSWHVVIMFLHLKGPGGKISWQDRFKVEVVP